MATKTEKFTLSADGLTYTFTLSYTEDASNPAKNAAQWKCERFGAWFPVFSGKWFGPRAYEQANQEIAIARRNLLDIRA